MKALKFATLCSFITALIFSMFSFAFYFGDWARLSFVALLGLFIGLIAAPELNPKIFKAAWSFQLLSGLICGGLSGWILQLNDINSYNAIILGGLLGWTAPFWVKHVPIP